MSITDKETIFLSILASREEIIFDFASALKHWGSRDAAKSAVKRLVQKRRVLRLEGGKYLVVPLEAGPDRLWTENSFVISSYLIEDGVMAYWSALRIWNLTDQLPRTVFIQSTKRKRNLTILNVDYRFVAVQEKRYFGNTTVKIQNHPVPVTDLEKTILDGLSRPDISGGILTLADALKLAAQSIDINRLIDYLVRWEGGTVPKRIGYLIEHEKINFDNRERLINKLQSLITKGISLLEPGAGKTGKISTRWQIKDNIFIQ